MDNIDPVTLEQVLKDILGPEAHQLVGPEVELPPHVVGPLKEALNGLKANLEAGNITPGHKYITELRIPRPGAVEEGAASIYMGKFVEVLKESIMAKYPNGPDTVPAEVMWREVIGFLTANPERPKVRLGFVISIALVFMECPKAMVPEMLDAVTNARP